MAEDKNKQALDLGTLATGGTQETEQLNDEQLDEVSGGAGWPWDANPIFPD